MLRSGKVPGIVPSMVPGQLRFGSQYRLQAADYARQRREALGLTQSEVAAAAGVRDVKTIRNLETGRNWPNDLTRRGIETALQVEIGTLDRIAEVGDTGKVESPGVVADEQDSVPTAQEMIDLSSAISKLSSAHEAMLRRGDDRRATAVRSLIDAVSAVMAAYGPASAHGSTSRSPDQGSRERSERYSRGS